MRNRITHRLPFELIITKGRLCFPDDPYSEEYPPTFKDLREVSESSKKWIAAIMPFVDKAAFLSYGELGVVEYINNESRQTLLFDRRHGQNPTYEEFLDFYDVRKKESKKEE